MNNVALITGASSGIGRELARIHASRKGDLVLVARRAERLLELKTELEQAHGVQVLTIARDLAVPGAAKAIYKELTDKQVDVEVLINNAGFGGHGFFYERDWEADKAMINLNILALTALTRMFLPGMVERNRGCVMNVASTAGFIPGPLQAVYYASKAYVISFSEALANELSDTNVTVTALCPNFTQTEFIENGNLTRTRAVKLLFIPTARTVADYGYRAMLRGKTMAVFGIFNKFAFHILLRILPRKLVTAISRSTMEKEG
ncbi:MAG: SDR family oxidoreductase [Rhodothermales bacterium]